MISFILTVRQPFRFALLLFYVGCIVALSLLPPQNLPKVQLFRGADKLIHFTMYLIFSVLSCWSLKSEENGYAIWLILPVTIGWGILMEYIQLEMGAGRSFSMYDILANSTGVVVGILLYIIASRIHNS